MSPAASPPVLDPQTPNTNTTTSTATGGAHSTLLMKDPSPSTVREWICQHHRKHLAVLDTFLLELQHTSSNSNSRRHRSTPVLTTTAARAVEGVDLNDRLVVALRTIDVLRHLIGATRWKSPAQLLILLRGIGKELDHYNTTDTTTTKTNPQGVCSNSSRSSRSYRTVLVLNIVRRIMAAVREEAVRENPCIHQHNHNYYIKTSGYTISTTAADADADAATTTTTTPAAIPALSTGTRTTITPAATDSASSSSSPSVGGGGGRGDGGGGGRLSLQSMLWALPQHVRSKSTSSYRGENTRQESFGTVADLDAATAASAAAAAVEYPSTYYLSRPDLKHSIMEAIQELVAELEDVHRNINEHATSHIHEGEIILTIGHSKTIEEFLKCASAKNHRSFTVLVCEGAPHRGGHAQAAALTAAGINTILVSDASVFAVMARVHKVLLPAHAILANGGLVADAGCNVVAFAAHRHSVPVVCVSGLYKLCPMFPHQGQDTLNDLESPLGALMNLHEMRDPLLREVEYINPLHDYVKPNMISLYVTNVGSFQPSFTYRLLAEYYHVDDWEAFE